MIEHKDLRLDDCNLKFSTGGNAARRFEGYASVWDSVDSYGDTMKRGAFSKSVKSKQPPLMFYGHNGPPIGRWLDLREDEKGLAIAGELTPGHSVAEDVYASLRHGAMSGLSVGGYTRQFEPKDKDDPLGLEKGRVIKEFELKEVSVVAFPAETGAQIDLATVKEAVENCATLSELERLLRDATGWSKKAATAYVARLRRLVQRDAVQPPQSNAEAKELIALLRTSSLPELSK